MRNSLTLRLGVIALALAVIGTACSSGTDGSPGEASGSRQGQSQQNGSDGMEAVTTVDSGAAQLRRDLTDLLDGHVYLAGIAVEQAVLTEDPNSPQFKAAATTLDQNSQDLAAAIESIYGPEAGKQFLSQWRQHIDFFVDYTIGGISNDANVQQKAAADLAQYQKDFGAFLEEATGGELQADAAAQALQMHVNSLLDTIDAVIAGDASAFDMLYGSAHEHMPMTAGALAGAIAGQMPESF
jgi:hypothetical protein